MRCGVKFVFGSKKIFTELLVMGASWGGASIHTQEEHEPLCAVQHGKLDQ